MFPVRSSTVSTRSPSGTQIHLARGDQRATVVEVGGGIREYAVADRPVFAPCGETEVAPAFHGAVLVPWPNRLADGRFEYGGRPFQVPITEVDRGTALHGLACWHRWDVVDQTEAAAELALALPRHSFASRTAEPESTRQLCTS